MDKDNDIIPSGSDIETFMVDISNQERKIIRELVASRDWDVVTDIWSELRQRYLERLCTVGAEEHDKEVARIEGVEEFIETIEKLPKVGSDEKDGPNPMI